MDSRGGTQVPPPRLLAGNEFRDVLHFQPAGPGQRSSRNLAAFPNQKGDQAQLSPATACPPEWGLLDLAAGG
jgi:hypothetical protein